MAISKIPKSWLDLIVQHSSLGVTAISTLETIESRISQDETQGAQIFPLPGKRYAALEAVSPENTKVILIGQDPYHGLATLSDGSVLPEAMGLSFSVPKGVRIPPSLRNIHKELRSDIGCPIPDHGDLTAWANQDVLLLNSILSVEKDRPKSHHKFGWELITGALIEAISKTRPGLVFVLWGNNAKALKERIVSNGHTIIESSHPSPIGGSCNKGFFGSKPFSRANTALIQAGKEPIDWNLSK